MESSLFILVPLSVAVVFLTGWIFWKALHGGQFDDLERPAHAVLESEFSEDAAPFDLSQTRASRDL